MPGLLDWANQQYQGLLDWGRQWPHGEGLLGKPMAGQMMDMAQRTRGMGPLEAWNDPAYRDMAHNMALALQVNTPGKGIRAFHGSPHDFDKFSKKKIGTGEGMQAYGHGLYFAEAEDVAKQYRDTLGRNNKKWLVDGEVVGQYGALKFEPIGTAAANVRAAMGKDGVVTKEAVDAALAKMDAINRTNPGMWPADAIARTKAEMANLIGRNVAEDAGGKMYEVNINAAADDFLDWDKPLSQQSEKVRGAVGNVSPVAVKNDWDAESLLSALERGKPSRATPASAAKATEALRKAGIPGIKYLDQGSRAAGEGSRNYVVFDDALIEIIRKYGLAGLLGMGGAGLAGGLLGTPDAQAKGLLDAPY